MTVIDALGDVEEVAVRVEVSALYIPVTPAASALQSDGPAVFHQAGGDVHAYVVEAVVAKSVEHAAATLGVKAASSDVDGTADRGSREYGCTQTALCLDVGSHVTKACPVGPVHPAAFHIVDGNTVDEDSDVGALEAAHVYFGITKTTAVFGSPDAGSGFEYFGEFLRTEFVLDVSGIYLADGHRGLACASQRLRNDDVVENFGLRGKGDDSHIAGSGDCDSFASYKAKGECGCLGRDGHVEVSVDISGAYGILAGDDHTGANDRFAVLVNDNTGTFHGALGEHAYACQAHHHEY